MRNVSLGVFVVCVVCVSLLCLICGSSIDTSFFFCWLSLSIFVGLKKILSDFNFYFVRLYFRVLLDFNSLVCGTLFLVLLDFNF